MKVTAIILATIFSASHAFQAPAKMTGCRTAAMVLHARDAETPEDDEMKKDLLSVFKNEKTRAQAISQGASLFAAALGVMGMEIEPADAEAGTLDALNIFKSPPIGTKTDVVATFGNAFSKTGVQKKSATVEVTGPGVYEVTTTEGFPTGFMSQTLTFNPKIEVIGRRVQYTCDVHNKAKFAGDRTIESDFTFNVFSEGIYKGQTKIFDTPGLVGTVGINKLRGSGPMKVEAAT